MPCSTRSSLARMRLSSSARAWAGSAGSAGRTIRIMLLHVCRIHPIADPRLGKLTGRASQGVERHFPVAARLPQSVSNSMARRSAMAAPRGSVRVATPCCCCTLATIRFEFNARLPQSVSNSQHGAAGQSDYAEKGLGSSSSGEGSGSRSM